MIVQQVSHHHQRHGKGCRHFCPVLESTRNLLKLWPTVWPKICFQFPHTITYTNFLWYLVILWYLVWWCIMGWKKWYREGLCTGYACDCAQLQLSCVNRDNILRVCGLETAPYSSKIRETIIVWPCNGVIYGILYRWQWWWKASIVATKRISDVEGSSDDSLVVEELTYLWKAKLSQVSDFGPKSVDVFTKLW